jgi:hypothetical protein
LNRTDPAFKDIAPARNGFHQVWSGITEGPAHLHQAMRHGVIAHIGIWPQRLAQFSPAHEATRTEHQIFEKVEGLRTKFNFGSTAQQRSADEIQSELAE